MSSLVQAALTLRKTARVSFWPVVAAILLLLPVAGVFAGTVPRLEHLVLLVGWATVVALRVRRRGELERLHEGHPTGPTEAALYALDAELAAYVLAASHAAVQLFGGLGGVVHPLTYVAVGGIAAFARKPLGSVLVAFAILYEVLVWRWSDAAVPASTIGLSALFLVAFGALHVVLTQAELVRMRARTEAERSAERSRLEEQTRLFRLVGAPSAESAGSEEKVFRSSVDEVKDSLFHVLDLLRRTLDAHTAVLLLGSGVAKGTLCIAELVTESDDIADGPFDPGAGAVGAVATRGLTMNLEHLKPGYKGLCYYRGPATVRGFLGVPVEEGGQLVGALCVDRLSDVPFGPREEEILKAASRQVVRAIQNERVFVQLERTKREQVMLFKASQELGAALTDDQVVEAGLAAAGRIARFDFAAITAWDPEKKTHAVRVAVGEGRELVQGLSFRDNTSLTAMVVKNKHHLPYRGDFDARQQVLFTSKVNLPDMRSVLVLPLVVREDVIGTLALAAHRPAAFGDSVRPTLQVLGNQLAVALSNARAVARLEQMATTDGLTGCLNKRAFLDELEAKLRSAERFKKKLSLLVTDIDHFKNVNDTYGHATGDVVIKELGAILLRMKRDTDKVARFGGEEFCVLCEETDTDGAHQFAERVRQELEKTVFPTELGKLRVTGSIGVATYPRDAETAGGLFEITDKALYAAKRGGRNRVCTVKDL
jgi:diguanylate cyclase (GGDEF)-like protein